MAYLSFILFKKQTIHLMAKFSTFIIQLRSSQDSLLLAYIRIVLDKYVSKAERFASEVKKFFNEQVRKVDRSNA